MKINALRKRVLAGLVCLVPVMGWTGEGTQSVPSLGIGMSARAAGMGEAYGAVVSGADSLFWNPAGLARERAHTASFSHVSYVASSRMEALSYGQPLGQGGIGLGLQSFSAGSIAQLDGSGTEVGSFTPGDMAMSLGYAHEIGGGVLGGLTIKRVQSKVVKTQSGMTEDVGLVSPGWMGNKFHLSLAGLNLGGKLGTDPMPSSYRVGLAYSLTERWVLTAEGVSPKGGSAYGAAGTELVMAGNKDYRLSGRLGYNGRGSGDAGGAGNLAAGLGFRFRGASVDYAFVPSGGELDPVHRVSLSYAFGGGNEEPSVDKMSRLAPAVKNQSRSTSVMPSASPAKAVPAASPTAFTSGAEKKTLAPAQARPKRRNVFQ